MRRHRRSGERGAAAVEFALILPILLLLLGGIIDYGRYFYTQVQLANAAREGARGAIVGDVAACRAAIGAGASTCGGTTLVAGWKAPVVNGTCFGSAPDPSVSVQTTATFTFFFAGILPGVPSTTDISSTATMGCA